VRQRLPVALQTALRRRRRTAQREGATWDYTEQLAAAQQDLEEEAADPVLRAMAAAKSAQLAKTKAAQTARAVDLEALRTFSTSSAANASQAQRALRHCSPEPCCLPGVEALLWRPPALNALHHQVLEGGPQGLERDALAWSALHRVLTAGQAERQLPKRTPAVPPCVAAGHCAGPATGTGGRCTNNCR
jgi:hypothetical protein